MAFTFNGFGTKFYGEADLRPDGSFITTEWITAAYLPIVPLRSFRLAPAGGGVNIVIVQSQSYVAFEKLPIFWPQVGRIYAFVACTAAWLIATGWLFFAKWKILDGPNAPYLIFPFIIVAAVPFFAVWWVRRKAFHMRHLTAPEPPVRQ